MIERFWAKVEIGDVPEHRPELGPCWLWTAAADADGYGHWHFEGRNQAAHRVAYRLLIGPIPAGLVLDHLCRVTSCVRPAHTEPVTHRLNHLRGVVTRTRRPREADEDSWLTVLREQGEVDRRRTMRWLAEQTGKSHRTVYAYSSGQITPPAAWLAEASRVLGQEVAA